MKLHFTIDVGLIETDAPFPSVTSEIQIDFSDITNHEDWHIQETDSMRITLSPTTSQLDFYYEGGGGESVTQHFDEVSTNFQTIEFDGEITSGFENLDKFVSIGVVKYETINNETLVYLYTQNSENNALNKDITLVNIIGGKFNHSIGVKSLNIDVVNINMNFNYAYIPSLNRYYYVDSIEIISNDVRRLHLKEDVLTSWNLLIRKQSAFILRRENGSNRSVLSDERLPLEDKISFQHFTINNGSLKNITFNYNPSDSERRYCVISYTSEDTFIGSDLNINSPSNSGLPNIISHLNNKTDISFINKSELDKLTYGLYANAGLTSYIENIMWFPFDVTNVFTTRTNKIFVGDKVLKNDGTWGSISDTNALYTIQSRESSSPYLIIADFTFNQSGGIDVIDSMLMRKSYWDIYIPFVGWVNVDFAKVYGERILIYYSMDLKTGISTAYIYNFTSKKVIYSTTCTIGIKVDFTTSNMYENIKQKQANDLNMLISGLSSALSIGVGVATENPVAIAGGVLSLGKGIASYVNTNNMLIERANISFGTSDGALYSPLAVSVRRSYHAPIFIDTDVYGHMQGYPSNEYVLDFEDVYGYVEIGEIHFNPFNEVIYQDEITEIVTLLKDGVIF